MIHVVEQLRTHAAALRRGEDVTSHLESLADDIRWSGTDGGAEIADRVDQLIDSGLGAGQLADRLDAIADELATRSDGDVETETPQGAAEVEEAPAADLPTAEELDEFDRGLASLLNGDTPPNAEDAVAQPDGDGRVLFSFFVTVRRADGQPFDQTDGPAVDRIVRDSLEPAFQLDTVATYVVRDEVRILYALVGTNVPQEAALPALMQWRGARETDAFGYVLADTPHLLVTDAMLGAQTQMMRDIIDGF